MDTLRDFDTLTNRDIKSGKIVAGSILDLFFNTPIVRINNLVDDSMGEVFAKLEHFSPGGSVKDRVALAMIEQAEKEGILKKGSVVVEPTCGNTGISIALVCAVKGYKCIIVMPETLCLERIYILESYGAKVVITPSDQGIDGSIKKAKEIISKMKNAVMLDKFRNLVNPIIHEKTTAREIISALGCNIDAFVAGVGTGGTITGVGRALKRLCPNVKIYAVEPENSPVLRGGKPGTHKIQGIGAGFIPEILDTSIIDEVIGVKDIEAFKTMQALATKEGIFVGISGGAAMYASLKVAKIIGKGKKVLTILPDTGERYFSIKQYFEF